MKLYIDKEFLDNFFISFDDKNKYHKDLEKFFKKIKGYKLVINLNNFKEFESACREGSPEYNPILEALINEYVPEISFLPELNEKLKNEQYHKNDPYPFKLHFIEEPETITNQLIKDFGFEFISTQNMNERWKCYYSEREDFKLKVTKDKAYPDELKFDSYEKLKQFKHPINSILIFDLYIFSNTPHQQINDNFIPLLKNLVDFKPEKAKLHISVVTEIMYKEVKELLYELKQKISEFIPKEKFELSIIRHSKKHYPKNLQGLKPRRIYTNYFTIGSDDSFTYFKSNGAVNKLSSIWFDFNFNYVNWLSMSKDLNEINKYKTALPHYDNKGLLFCDKKEHCFDNISLSPKPKPLKLN